MLKKILLTFIIIVIVLMTFFYKNNNLEKCIPVVDEDGNPLEVSIYDGGSVLNTQVLYENGRYLGESKNGMFCFHSTMIVGNYYNVGSVLIGIKFSSTNIPDKVVVKKRLRDYSISNNFNLDTNLKFKVELKDVNFSFLENRKIDLDIEKILKKGEIHAME